MSYTKKALVIFNPLAGVKSKLNAEKLVRDKLEQLDYLVDLFYLNPDFERNIAGYDFMDVALVAAVGGDGTVKVAARTILENKLSAPLAILPFGSANVVALTAGLPAGIKNSLKLLEDIAKTMAIDVGLINQKYYFLVGLSIGYVSQIITGASPNLKNRLGFLSYLLRFVFNKVKMKRLKFEIRTPNKTFWVKGSSLVVFNSLNYYGLKTKKVISFTDGILNLYVFTNKTLISLLEAFFLMIFYRQPPHYILTLDGNYFKISLRRTINSCQIDGDRIKLPKVIEVKILPQTLKIITGK